MEILIMGKVVVPARIENQSDLTMVAKGHLQQEKVRSLEVSDALVDTALPCFHCRKVWCNN